MSDKIHELLNRNLQEVFGEGDAARRLSAILDPTVELKLRHYGRYRRLDRGARAVGRWLSAGRVKEHSLCRTGFMSC